MILLYHCQHSKNDNYRKDTRYTCTLERFPFLLMMTATAGWVNNIPNKKRGTTLSLLLRSIHHIRLTLHTRKSAWLSAFFVWPAVLFMFYFVPPYIAPVPYTFIMYIHFFYCSYTHLITNAIYDMLQKSLVKLHIITPSPRTAKKVRKNVHNKKATNSPERLLRKTFGVWVCVCAVCIIQRVRVYPLEQSVTMHT